MSQNEKPDNVAAGDAVEEALANFRRQMDWAKTTFAIGSSFARYRSGDTEEAGKLIGNLPFEQRDTVLRWAAYLVGLGE